MTGQIIVYTKAGPVIGKASEISEDEAADLKEALKAMGNNINYLDLDTERGWVVIPGRSVQFIELVIDREA